jgi:hypothetical protein
MLPAAMPTMTMLTNTLIMPSVWLNTNPPSSQMTTEMAIDSISVRVLESMMNLSSLSIYPDRPLSWRPIHVAAE